MAVVTDAEILAAFATLTLYIVRHNYSSKAKLKRLNTAVREDILPNINILVNDSLN